MRERSPPGCRKKKPIKDLTQSHHEILDEGAYQRGLTFMDRQTERLWKDGGETSNFVVTTC